MASAIHNCSGCGVGSRVTGTGPWTCSTCGTRNRRGFHFSQLNRAGKITVWVFAGIVALGIYSSLNGGSGSGGGGSGDAGAELACTHFRDVARDFGNGLLTLEELRGKLQEVDSNAKYSSSPGVAAGSQAMLRDITQGDIGALTTDLGTFSAACQAVGF